MRKQALALSTLVVLAAGVAFAGNGAPSGRHYNVNLIGAKKAELTNFLKGGNAETSNGSSIFIPLVTSKRPSNFNSETMTCTSNADGSQTQFIDEVGPTFSTVAPDGKVRIYFEPTFDGTFQITDRDAVDGSATIQIPVDATDGNTVLVDLWVRVLGKPGGCAEISGYAYEEATVGGQTMDLWWYAGSVLMNRTGGKSPFINATDIFETEYCNVEYNDAGVLACVPGTEQTVSVFDDIFSEYFWEVNNYNTRLIQLRFYVR